MKKKNAALLLVALIACTNMMAAEVSAAELPDCNSPQALSTAGIVTPYWTETSFAKASLTASGKTLTAGISIRAKNANTKITGRLYLEIYQNGKWSQVTSWPVSGTGKVNLTKVYTGKSGSKYRSRFSGTVGSEPITDTSNTISIN